MRYRYISLAWAAMAAASCGGGDATAPQQAAAASVAAVLVDPPTSTISIGAAVPLQAQVQDGDGKLIPVASVIWTVKDSTIATVSPAGVVTAQGLGTTQVAASFNGKSGVATVTVQKVPVASVALQPSHVDLLTGGTRQLGATPYDAGQNALADRAVSWSSSNERVATVDAAGLLTAIGAGTAVITATSEGKSATATVTVTAPVPVANVVVAPATAALVFGQTATFAATPRDAANNVLTGRAIVWSSSDAGVATVSSSGVVTPTGAGSATITATSEGKSGSAKVTVTIPVASVALQPASLTIAPGQTAGLTATTTGANGAVLSGRTVTYASSNTAVARVSGTGVVTGISNGTATITATSEGKTATVAVAVQPGNAATVAVNPYLATIPRNGTIPLTATAYDSYFNPIQNASFEWQSSDVSVATVSSTGLVTAKRRGSVYITASVNGISASALIVIQ